jgi:hypothetical protein
MNTSIMRMSTAMAAGMLQSRTVIASTTSTTWVSRVALGEPLRQPNLSGLVAGLPLM